VRADRAVFLGTAVPRKRLVFGMHERSLGASHVGAATPRTRPDRDSPTPRGRRPRPTAKMDAEGARAL